MPVSQTGYRPPLPETLSSDECWRFRPLNAMAPAEWDLLLLWSIGIIGHWAQCSQVCLDRAQDVDVQLPIMQQPLPSNVVDVIFGPALVQTPRMGVERRMQCNVEGPCPDSPDSKRRSPSIPIPQPAVCLISGFYCRMRPVTSSGTYQDLATSCHCKLSRRGCCICILVQHLIDRVPLKLLCPC